MLVDAHEHVVRHGDSPDLRPGVGLEQRGLACTGRKARGHGRRVAIGAGVEGDRALQGRERGQSC